MKRPFSGLLLVAVIAVLSGCSSGPFTIKNTDFQASDACSATGTVEISMESGQVQVKMSSNYKTRILLTSAARTAA